MPMEQKQHNAMVILQSCGLEKNNARMLIRLTNLDGVFIRGTNKIILSPNARSLERQSN
jgi:hypothetical protein